jgi:hypothetical protein
MSNTTTTPAVNPFAPTATSGGSFDQCPSGNWSGMLATLVDLGTHWDSYKDQAEKKVRKIALVFEVEAEKEGKAQRFYIGGEFSLGYNDAGNGLIMGKKSRLRAMMEGWAGKSYGDGEVPDFTRALGRPCIVNVKHEANGDKTYARLDSVTKPVAGMKVIEPTRKPFAFRADSRDEAPGALDTDKSEWLPRIFGERIHTIIARCLERGGTGRKGVKSDRPLSEHGEPLPHGANAPVEQQAEEAF